MKKNLGILLIAALSYATPALAQSGACEAKGTILDGEDNPIPDVVVVFSADGNPSMTYKGKTNKNGKYWVSGLYTPKENDRWNLSVEAEGYIPTNVKIVSRNVNKVLVGDLDKKLSPGSKISDIIIRPMGFATIDLTMDKEEAVMERLKAQRRQQALAAAPQFDPDAPAQSPEAPLEPETDPWDEALIRVQDGDLEGSLPLFVEAIEDKPDDVERLEWYAKVLYQSGRYEDAEVAAIQVIERAPDRLDARVVLASVYMGSNQLDQAKTVLDQAIEVAPDDLEIRKRAAVVSAKLGLTEEAIASYEAITEIDPEDAAAWQALGALYAESGKRRKSAEAFGKAGALGAEDAHRTLFNQGVLIMENDDRTEADTRRAIDAFSKAVEIQPDYAQAYLQLAYSLLGVGDRDGALQAFKDYLRVAPDGPAAGGVKSLIKTLEG